MARLLGSLTRHWTWVVFLIGTLHAGAYALTTPLWQAPDEPGHLEYACLLGQLERPPEAADTDAALETRIIASLVRNDFWRQVREAQPDPLPGSFAADPFLFRSGRQVGDEPWPYYLVPALICRTALSLEAQVRLIRVYGALLFGLTGVAAAWAWQDERPHRSWSAGSAPEATGGPGMFGRLHPAVIVLLPMPAFIAGSANNDGLAILAATAVFAAAVRIQRLGWSWRRGLGLVVLLAVALASKKTTAFLLPWLLLLGLASGWQQLQRWPHRQRQVVWGLAAAVLLLSAAMLLPSNAPGGWRGRAQPVGRGLVPVEPAGAGQEASGRAVQVVDDSFSDYGRLFQSVTGAAALALLGQEVEATAWVRSAAGQPQPGRLTVRDTGGYSQASFTAGESWQLITLQHLVDPATTYVKIALAPGEGSSPQETGHILVDGVALRQGSGPNLLRNGDLEQPASWGELLVVAPLEERWQQFAPRLQAGGSLEWPAMSRYGLYVALAFAGFWGNFGWLQQPLPIWLYGLQALVCLAALIGLLRPGGRDADESEQALSLFARQRPVVRSWLLAGALIAVQTAMPMLGRDWQPQGRYLFPALFPLTGLLLVGLDRWLDLCRHPRRAGGLLAALLGFAAYALLR